MTIIRRSSISLPKIGIAWIAFRLVLEVPFPFIPFQTSNSFIRIALEWPFYLAASYLLEMSANPGLLALTVIAVTLEAVTICLAIFATSKVLAYIKSRRKPDAGSLGD